MPVIAWFARHDPGLCRAAARRPNGHRHASALRVRRCGDRRRECRDVRGVRLLRHADAGRLRRPDARSAAGPALAGGAGRRARVPRHAGVVQPRVARRRGDGDRRVRGLFAGTVSSVLASASTSLLLAFILPVGIPGTVESIAPRLLGWGMAAVVGIVAVALLWPAPAREPLRAPAATACRALAARLRADVAYLHGNGDPGLQTARTNAAAAADAAVATLQSVFLASPFRPTGLSTSARTVVRLVDELIWLNTRVSQSAFSAAAMAPSKRGILRARRFGRPR